MCDLLKEQIEGFSITQQSHRIVVVKEADTMVMADRVRIGSVITNLLSNAIKYSPHRTEVVVSIERPGYS